MIKIIVDTLGGDLGPASVLEGSIRAINENNDIHLILVGPEDVIKEELKKYKYNEKQISIIHSTEEITCHDKPTVAIKKKTNSSMVIAFDTLKANDDINAFVTLGSTGAVLTGAVLKAGRIKGVKRPAFCPILPTVEGGIVSICDSGANVDCEPYYLQQFALMGSLYLEKGYNIKNPRVALLNVGVEDEKGDLLRKEAFQLIKSTEGINFVGNMESRDLLTGKYDLVVCDGFSGNVLIKSTEGACLEVMKLIKKAFTANLKNKLGALLLKKDVYKIKDLMDYNNYGGGVMLGVTKTIVKGHGSSKSTAVFHCINQAYNMEKNNLRQAIAEGIAKLTEEKENQE